MRSRQPLSRLLLAAWLLAVGVLAPAGAGGTGAAATRIKAVQVLVEKSPTTGDLRRTLAAYRRAGFDTVIMRAFHLPDDRPHAMAGPVREDSTGVYFATDHAPVLADVMTPFVRISREEGLRPFAWMVTRKGRFDNRDLPHDVMYDPARQRFRPLPDLDMLNPATWPYLEGLFADLARTGVDGILLQDDLASRMIEGFSRDNIVRYLEETGAFAPPWEHLGTVTGDDGRVHLTADREFDRWIRWKSKVMVELAVRLQAACSRTRPGIVLVMNQMYESITDPDNGRLWLAQDLDLVLSRGPAYAAVMLYHDQMRRELGLTLPGTLELMDNSLDRLARNGTTRSRVLLKFQTHSWRTGAPLPAAELKRALEVVRGEGWSVALVPPPTDAQLEAIGSVLGGL